MKIQELRLINQILIDNSWELLTDNDILDSDFSQGTRPYLKFVRDYQSKYNAFPPLDVFESECEAFPSKVDKEFALRQYRKHATGSKLKELIESTREIFASKNNPEAALDYLKAGINQFNTHEKIKSYRELGHDRIEDTKNLSIVGIRGVETPWPSANEAFEVWENSTLNLIGGISSTGKTWCSCIAAEHAAFNQKKNVLLVVMENSRESIIRRLDALHYNVSFNDRRRGMIDFRQWPSFKERVIEDMNSSDRGDIWIADNTQVKTVADVQSLMTTQKFDLVIIDGAYLLGPSNAKLRNPLEKSECLVEDLRMASVNSTVPWIATVQLNNAAGKMSDSKDAVFETRGNKSWYIVATTVMGLIQDEEDRPRGRVKVLSGKVREAGDYNKEYFYINSDRVNMDFSEIEEEYVNTEILEDTI